MLPVTCPCGLLSLFSYTPQDSRVSPSIIVYVWPYKILINKKKSGQFYGGIFSIVSPCSQLTLAYVKVT